MPDDFVAERRSPGYLLAGTWIDPASPREARRMEGAIAIGIRTETIRDVGALDQLRREYPTWPVVKLDGCVILPTFADAHTHWTEYAIRGKGPTLTPLAWLEQEVYAEEKRFTDSNYARAVCVEFFHDLIRQGTLMAFVWSSPHPAALSVFFDTPIVGRWLAGNALMDRMAPQEYRQSTDMVIGQMEDCAFSYGAKYVISPRFVPACSPELLSYAGGLALDDPWVQTHLGTDPDEVSLVKQLAEGDETATDMLDRAHLLSGRTLLSHCNYVDEREWRAIAALDCVIVHCPGSEIGRGIERMSLEKVRHLNLRWALGSEVGAAPTLSMLYAMQSFLRLHRPHAPVTAAEALYRCTAALPEILGTPTTGRLFPGFSADVVALKCPEAAREPDVEKALQILCEGTWQQLEELPVVTLHRAHPVAGVLPEPVR